MVATADGLGDMAFRLGCAARVGLRELARKREEMLGISPVACGATSISAGLRGQFDGWLSAMRRCLSHMSVDQDRAGRGGGWASVCLRPCGAR
jgi:hypothetical protein